MARCLSQFLLRETEHAETGSTTSASITLAIIQIPRLYCKMSFPLSKCLCALILGAGALSAADYSTGQGARLVIGQRTFTAHDFGLNGTSNVLLGAAGGGLRREHTVRGGCQSRRRRSINNRVLLYISFPPSCPNSRMSSLKQPVATYASGGERSVGPAGFCHNDHWTSQTGLRTPTAVASDGQILAVADTDNNRVLIWRSIPTSNNTPADVVIGQPTLRIAFTSVPRPRSRCVGRRSLDPERQLS